MKNKVALKKPKKIEVVPKMIDYHDMIEYIEQKYNIEVRGYVRKEDMGKKNVEYLDYWHWLLDHCFDGMGNPSTQFIPVYNMLNDEGWAPDWVIEITTLIDKEFHKDLDDGALQVWISW